MAILKNDIGLIQLHKCPKCNYLVQWNDTVNEEHLCKWCAAEHRAHPTPLRCICTQLTALEPIVNPDCPVHGSLRG